jgi:hypothetical protein
MARSKSKLVATVMNSPVPGAVENAQGLSACSDSGKLRDFMAAEHSRLDHLLAGFARDATQVESACYEEFRKILLRHISIEQKILLPAAQRRRGGTPLPLAQRLGLDHGALAALMMLPPSPSTFAVVRAVLDAHNPLEEGPAGVYEQCQELLRSELDALLTRCEDASQVPVSPWVDSPKVLAAAKRALARAGYDAALLDPADEKFG